MNNTCNKCTHKKTKQCEKCCYNWRRLKISELSLSEDELKTTIGILNSK